MLRNFTPHSITLIFPAGETITLPSEGIARVAVKEIPTTSEPVAMPSGEVMDFPVFYPTFGAVEGLPEPDGHSTFIVSAIVREAVQKAKRLDCVSPARLVRDGAGNVVGCAGFHY